MIPVRCSNQLSYEATDVGNWSFVGSNEPVRNACYWVWKPEFFRLPYAIAKIAFVTGRIKAYLTFIHVVVRFGDY